MYIYVDINTNKNIITNEIVKIDKNNKGLQEPVFNSKQVYEINCIPNATSDIILEPEEYIYSGENSIILGDTDRWDYTTSLSKENGKDVVHILVKPWEDKLETSLTITTTRRTYNLMLYSNKTNRTPMIKWIYRKKTHINPSVEVKKTINDNKETLTTSDNLYINPRYIIKRPKKAPVWTPEIIYDDGIHTYIRFPKGSQNYEIPTVTGKNGEFINKRLLGDLMILDNLIEEIYLISGKIKIKIIKERD